MSENTPTTGPMDALMAAEEAAIDVLYGRLATVVAAEVRKLPPGAPVSVQAYGRIMKVVDRELAKLHGTSRADAIDSPMGRLVEATAYAGMALPVQANVQQLIGEAGTGTVAELAARGGEQRRGSA